MLSVCTFLSGPQQQCPNPDAFKAAMAATFDELRRVDEGASWGETQFRNSADTLAHVLELVRQYKVTLPGHICAVVVTTLVLEGWSNKLDPDHSVLTQVRLKHVTDRGTTYGNFHLSLVMQ